MALTKWGFIYTLGTDATDKRTDVVGSPACVLVAVGVPTVDDAPAAARELVDDGVELIELCGAFGAPGTAAVVAAVGPNVPVGAPGTAAVVAAVGPNVPVGGVFYGGEATSGLNTLFS